MAVNVKAFLEKNGDVKGEIRRFQIPNDPPEQLYHMLTRKVADIFSIPADCFELFWQDCDGDFVVFSSTMEVKEAVDNSLDGLLRIFIRQTSTEGASSSGPKDEKSQDKEMFHPGVICDGCEKGLYGPRFKCIVCPDYDLCSKCEQKGIHPEHDKLKITHPRNGGFRMGEGFQGPHFPRWMEGFMNLTGGKTAQEEQGKCKQMSEENIVKWFQDHVSALNSWGFPIDLEVHRDEPQGNCNGGNRRAGGCCRPRSNGNSTCRSENPKPSTSSEGEKQDDKPVEKPAEKPATEEMDVEPEKEKEQIATMEEEASAPEPQETLKKEASPTGSNDEDWTLLHNEGEITTDGAAAAAPEGLYPNLKVTQAVEMMKTMGFNDDGGWLTHLLETTDGDIVRALDKLKLGSNQGRF